MQPALPLSREPLPEAWLLCGGRGMLGRGCDAFKKESQMVVPISVRCPHCQAKLKLPSEKLLGKKLP